MLDLYRLNQAEARKLPAARVGNGEMIRRETGIAEFSWAQQKDLSCFQERSRMGSVILGQKHRGYGTIPFGT